MSEIQRYKPMTAEGFLHYTDLLWYQRQYRMALVINIVVVLVCAVLAGYLVYHKHDPQPVAKVSAEETVKKAELLNDLKANHERAVSTLATANKVYHGSAKDLERVKGLLELNANLKAQIIEQNKHLNPQQQTERLNAAGPAVHGGDRYASAVVPSTTLHDGQVAALAREVGFTRVRVVE